MTQWLSVLGFEGYSISDDGRVYSHRSERFLQAADNGSGYLQVRLYRDRQSCPRFVHRLILEAFTGSCPEGQEALHENDIRADNRLANLRWGTHGENMLDMVANGNHHCASRSCCANGHEYTTDNTYLRNGHRHCRECQRRRNRKYRAKKER